MSAIVLLTLRMLAGRKRLLVLTLLVAVPVALAVIYAFSETTGDGSHFAIELFDNVILPAIMPLTALIVAASALGNEVEDHTLVYLMLRPVPRAAIVVAKYLASFVLVTGLVEASAVLTYAVASRKTESLPLDIVPPVHDVANIVTSLLLAGLGGCAAYAALFLLAGLLMPQRGLLVGFVYVLVWEGIAAGLSSALATFSVRRYVQGLLDSRLGDTDLAQIATSTLSLAGSIIGLLVICVSALALTTWRLKRMEQASG